MQCFYDTIGQRKLQLLRQTAVQSVTYIQCYFSNVYEYGNENGYYSFYENENWNVGNWQNENNIKIKMITPETYKNENVSLEN